MPVREPEGALRPDPPAPLRPQPRRYWLGSVHVVQLLTIEAVVLGVLIVSRRGPVVVGAAALIALAVTGLVLRRRQGRWLFEWRDLRRRFAARSREHPVGHDDPRLAALRGLAGGLSVGQLQAQDGTRIGIAADDAGWFAVIESSVSAGLPSAVAPGPPLERLARQIVESQVPGITLQVVTHTVPVPAPHIDPNCAAAQSYRDLARSVGVPVVPLECVTWVVLRLDPVPLAARAENSDVSPPAVLMTLVRRTAGVLRRVGGGWRVLDREGLIGALARSCDLESVAEAAIVAPVEEWTHWQSAGLEQATFWVRQWPEAIEPAALIDLFVAVPCAFSSVALITVPGPDPDQVTVRGLVRVAAPAGQLAAASAAVGQAAEQVRAQVQRLDGEHGPAVYASAPTGGGLG